MNLEVELPFYDDWKNERAIQVMAGIEFVAMKYPNEPWKVKTVRCNMCGECCKNLSENFFMPTINGQCVHLRENGKDTGIWECGLGVNRPFGCSIGEPNLLEKKDYCCIEWKTLE